MGSEEGKNNDFVRSNAANLIDCVLTVNKILMVAQMGLDLIWYESTHSWYSLMAEYINSELGDT